LPYRDVPLVSCFPSSLVDDLDLHSFPTRRSSDLLVLISVITLVLLHFRLPDSCLLVRVRFRLRHIGGDAHPCVQNRNLHPYRVTLTLRHVKSSLLLNSTSGRTAVDNIPYHPTERTTQR